MKRITLVLVGLLVIIVGSARAQQEATKQYEDFITKTGIIITKDIYEMGVRKGSEPFSGIEISALVVHQRGAPDKLYGLRIYIGTGNRPRYENSSFLDFEEAISLSEALQYMLGRAEKEEEYIEVHFNTRDYFTIGFYQETLKSTVFARSGSINPVTISFHWTQETLEDIKAFVDKGLDKLRSLGAK